MKTIFLITFMIAASILPAPDVSDETSKSNDMFQSEIPSDVYIAGVRAVRSINAPLPELDYWGVGHATWGATAPEISALTQNSATPTPTPACELGGFSCKIALSYVNGGLHHYRYSFAEAVSERGKRLDIYRILKSELVKRYGAPSENPFPDEMVRGQDAFVQGLDNRYQVRWNGPETNAELFLTEEDLFVEFSKAVGSSSRDLQRDFQAFETLRSTMPADHHLNQLDQSE